MSYFIGNSRTRESLKCAFEELFTKYGRPFSDDDEIDLETMSVAKQGNHLHRQRRKLKFGSLFTKHNTLALPSDYDSAADDDHDHDDERVELENGLEDRMIERKPAATNPVRKKLAKCLLSLEKKRMVSFASEFDQVFYSLCKSSSIGSHPCACGHCFDCRLYQIIKSQ